MHLLVLIPIAMFLLACEQKGPLEQAGEEIDEAVEDFQAGGETLGNKLDDAIDEARKDVEDAVDEVDPNN